MDDDHDFVIVDKLDALSIEPKPPSPLPAEQKETKETEKLTVRHMLNQAWLHQDLGKFPAKTHARMVARQLGVWTGMIYLPGQDEIYYEDSDMGFEFRQRRYFYYVTGADFPGCAVTYDIGRDSLILWIPHTDPKTILWNGRTPTPKQCLAASDVDDVRYIGALYDFLPIAVRPGSTVYCLHPDQVPQFQKSYGPVYIDTAKLVPAMDWARVIKTDYEVAMIRRANAVSSCAHKAVLSRLKHAQNERLLDAVFSGFCVSQGAKRLAYPTIAASGRNASSLHYDDNDQPLTGRQLVVLDAGAEWKCYASDITRTFPVSGAFSADAAAVYGIVERMQAECIRRVKPGVLFYTLHLTACRVAVAGLLKLGILRGTQEQILTAGTVAAFFPHGLGHHVGLEVHDVTGVISGVLPASFSDVMNDPPKRRTVLKSKREFVSAEMAASLYKGAVNDALRPAGGAVPSGQILAPNMVITIEPGIYFCREYIEGYFLNHPVHSKFINSAVLGKYWDVGGVRIEDDILVTHDGYENLTLAPKGEEMLSIINQGMEGRVVKGAK